MTTNKGVIAWFASNSVAANLLMIILIVGGLFSAKANPPNTITIRRGDNLLSMIFIIFLRIHAQLMLKTVNYVG